MTPSATHFDHILLLKHHRQPSERLLRSAVDLARRCCARLTFADAIEGGNQTTGIFQGARRRELKALLPPQVDGVEVDYRLIDGGLAEATEISDDFDLVFLADNSRVQAATGREISFLLRRSLAPIWLDGGAEHSPRRILAAVDILTADPLKLNLNVPILERAALLASVYHAELDVLSVWSPPAASLALVRRLVGTTGRVDRPKEVARQRLEETVEQALQLGIRLEREPRLLIGTGGPADTIARTADEHETDLLIAGCVGRDGLSGWLTGDTAERLSRRLGCSILAVKADPPQPGVRAA